jgi:hypothetical protein
MTRGEQAADLAAEKHGDEEPQCLGDEWGDGRLGGLSAESGDGIGQNEQTRCRGCARASPGGDRPVASPMRAAASPLLKSLPALNWGLMTNFPVLSM